MHAGVWGEEATGVGCGLAKQCRGRGQGTGLHVQAWPMARQPWHILQYSV